MSETSTAKSPAEELKDAEAALARAEQALTKARQDLREKRTKVMRGQVVGMASEQQDSHIALALANLELSDCEATETRATQAVGMARQKVDFCQRRNVDALKNMRIVAARVA